MWPIAHATMFFGMFFLHTCIMPFVMIESPQDFRFSLNQVYMAIHMSAWMIALEGWMHPMPTWAWIATFIILIASAFAIRKQVFVNEDQFVRDMIPHHSMAVLTSKHILTQKTSPFVGNLASQILQTQNNEINKMKKFLSQK